MNDNDNNNNNNGWWYVNMIGDHDGGPWWVIWRNWLTNQTTATDQIYDGQLTDLLIDGLPYDGWS